MLNKTSIIWVHASFSNGPIRQASCAEKRASFGKDRYDNRVINLVMSIICLVCMTELREYSEYPVNLFKGYFSEAQCTPWLFSFHFFTYTFFFSVSVLFLSLCAQYNSRQSFFPPMSFEHLTIEMSLLYYCHSCSAY